MLNLNEVDLNRIVSRQRELNDWADEAYDCYANKISMVAWRQKWIWDFLEIDVRRVEENESDTMESSAD